MKVPRVMALRILPLAFASRAAGCMAGAAYEIARDKAKNDEDDRGD